MQTYATPDPRAHYVELDALRGVAIAGVVMTHLAGFWFRSTHQKLEVPLLEANLLDLFGMGYLGVALFFLLSGYLLTWTEEKRFRQGSYSVPSYAKRRALRLVPAYYVAIVLFVVLWPTSPSPTDVATLFTFLQGFKIPYPTGLDPAVWSLTPEVVFYAALPLLVLKLRKLSQRLMVLGALFAVSLATRLLMSWGAFDLLPVVGEDLAGNRLYFFPTTLLYLFIVGMLLRMTVERVDIARVPGRRWLLPAMTVIPAALLVAFPYLGMRGGLIRSPLALIAEALVILVFASVLFGSPVTKPILNWRPLVFVGQISYSLFLLHTTVIFLSMRYLLFPNRLWFADQSEGVVWAAFGAYTVFVLLVSILLAYLSYRFIESPFLRQKPK